jgi:DNA repair exonuclease SbcCD ATPase subunit
MQRKGAGRGRGGERDVEAVLDELYATRPSEFVAAREELAVAARTAGRAEDARRIHAARRPTTAAWAANLLLRSAPEESRQFLELGRELREAYRTLDASGLKELSAQRRRVVSALSREAAGLARDAGIRLSTAVQQEVEATLQAVLADPEAADRWATGRLEAALTPPSEFPSGAGAGAVTGARPKSAPAEASPRPAQRRTKDELAERRRRRQEELARAREAAEAAERQLQDRRAEHADAEESLRRARDRHDEAEQQVATAQRRLEEAREELDRVGRERREAEKRQRSAADALARAEREAREAAKEAERLAGSRRG